jgi:hypothetical protein
MATTAQLAMRRLDEARCEALFASGLQPSDHPDAAARRMRWVRQLVRAAVRPPAGPGTRLDGDRAARGPVAA